MGRLAAVALLAACACSTSRDSPDASNSDCYPVLLSTCPGADCFPYQGMCSEAGGMCQSDLCSGPLPVGGWVEVAPGSCTDHCEGPSFKCCAPAPRPDASFCYDSCFSSTQVPSCGACCMEDAGCYQNEPYTPEGGGPLYYSCHNGHYELQPGQCETGDAGADGADVGSDAASDAPGDVSAN